MKESIKKKQQKIRSNSSDSLDSNNSFILEKSKIKIGMNMEERTQQKSDVKFHKMIYRLMNYKLNKIIDSKVFRHGVDQITSKSLADDIPYTSEQLTKCLATSQEYQQDLERSKTFQKELTEAQINRNPTNYELCQGLNKKLSEIIKGLDDQITEQNKLQEWLSEAIQMNLGVFEINDKTFIFDADSFGIFNYQSKFRIGIVQIALSSFLDNFTLLVIIFGSVCQAIYDYSDLEDEGNLNQIVNKALDACTFYFTFESVVKSIAQGFYKHKNAYLRDYWNILDFFIVLISLLDFISSQIGVSNLISLKSLRVMRVLRPLRSVKRIPSMKKLVDVLLVSLPDLMNTLLFMFFFMVVLGIIAIQSLFGITFQRCRLTKEPDHVTGIWPIDESQSNFICQDIQYDPDNSNTCQPNTYCGSVEIFSLRNIENKTVNAFQEEEFHWNDEVIGYGTTVQNDLFHSLIGIFESITLEGWSIQMYRFYQSGNYFSIFYYLMMIILGSYFILNLILAVIIGGFQSNSRESQEQDYYNDMGSISELEEEYEYQEGENQQNMDIQQQLQVQQMIEEQQTAINNQIEQKNFDEIQKSKSLDSQDENQLKQEQDPIQKIKQSQIPLKQENLVFQEQDTIQKIKQSLIPLKQANSVFSKQLIWTDQRDKIRLQSEKNLNKQETRYSDKEPDESAQIQNTSIVSKHQLLQSVKKNQLNFTIEQQPDNEARPHSQLFHNFYNQQQNEADGSQSSISITLSNQSKHSQTLQNEEFAEGGSPSEPQGCLENSLDYLNEHIITKASQSYEKTCLYRKFHKICRNKTFENLMSICILINTIVLSLDRFPISESESSIYDQVNTVSTFVFIAEMLIKMIGLGLKTYLLDGMNLFDCVVCIVSLIEFILNQQGSEQVTLIGKIQIKSENTSLTFFRAFRLLRAFKLAKKFRKFNDMIQKIGLTIKDMFTFFILLFIVLFVFSLLGVDLLNNQIKINSQGLIVQPDTVSAVSPRFNFDNFQNGLITCFIIMIGDNWNELMHDAMRSKQSILSSIYYVSLMIVGNWFLMSLFLAILLKNFEESPFEEDEEEEKQIQEIEFSEKIYLAFQSIKDKIFNIFSKKEIGRKSIEVQKQNREDDEEIDLENQNQEIKDPQNELSNIIKRRLTKHITFEQVVDNKLNHKPILQKAIESRKFLLKRLNTQKHELNGIIQQKTKNVKQQKLLKSTKEIILEGQSLSLFSSDNPFRNLILKILTSKFCEYFILLNVAISSILMIFDSPLQDQKSPVIIASTHVNTIVTVVFTIEVIFKWIVYGVINNGPQSYFKDVWNLIDFIITNVSILSIIFDNLVLSDASLAESSNKLELIKILRVLRSIRLITQSESIKISIMSLFYALPGIANLAIVIIMFFLLFGIFFLNLFKGKFYSCQFSGEMQQFISNSQIVTLYDCYNFGGRWQNARMNFDNIYEAIFSLLVLSFNESWQQWMNSGVDSVSYGMQPKQLNNFFYQFIFIFYLIVVSSFILNLFVEKIISSYNKEKDKLDKNYLLTKFQKEWVMIQLKVYNAKPKPKILTHNKIRLFCIQLVEHNNFENVIILSVLINSLALCLVWVGITQGTIRIVDFIQQACNIIFMIEAFLKIIAYQNWYFTSSWNLFDFLVVIFGIIGLFLSDVGSTFSIFRILRICRVLKLLKKAKSLYLIFNSFLNTIPSFSNVGILVIILIYMFSIMFNRLFAMIKIGGNLNELYNFQSFWSSFLTLIVVMTGEDWPNTMFDIGHEKSIDFDCQTSQSYDEYIKNNKVTNECGNKKLAIIVMLIFQIFVSLILINLFIAVTLQGYYQQQREDSCRVSDNLIDSFIKIWGELDPESTGYIHISEISNLLHKLVDNECQIISKDMKNIQEKQLQNFIGHLNLKLYRKYQFYNFYDVLNALSLAHLIYLVQQDSFEQESIMAEFNSQNERNQVIFKIEKKNLQTLEEVLDYIDEISNFENVEVLSKLNTVILNFQREVELQIDVYENKVYSSNTVIQAIKIQRAYKDFIIHKKRHEKLRRQKEKKHFVNNSLRYRKKRNLVKIFDQQYDDDEEEEKVQGLGEIKKYFLQQTNMIMEKQIQEQKDKFNCLDKQIKNNRNRLVKLRNSSNMRQNELAEKFTLTDKVKSKTPRSQKNMQKLDFDFNQQTKNFQEIQKQKTQASPVILGVDQQVKHIQFVQLEGFDNLSGNQIKQALKEYIQKYNIQQQVQDQNAESFQKNSKQSSRKDVIPNSWL